VRVTADPERGGGLVLVRVAGAEIPDALEKVVDYVEANGGRTLRRYDLPGPGDPQSLAAGEVTRTRLINSRISNRQRDCLLALADQPALWRSVPAEAILADADPQERGGLYDACLALFDHFMQVRSTGISTGKTSKVLHVKRPALFPILDSRVRRAYRRRARAAAAQHNSCRQPAVRYAYWAAIREDVTSSGKRGCTAPSPPRPPRTRTPARCARRLPQRCAATGHPDLEHRDLNNKGYR